MPLTETPKYTRKHGDDIHVLRVQDGDLPTHDPVVTLSELLTVTWQTGPNPEDTESGTFDEYPQPDAGPDVVLDFKPVFKFVDGGTNYHGFGVVIEKTTGEIRVGEWPAADPAPSNFIVEATVKQNGPEANPPFGKARLRIHLHRSVTDVWMTPPQLSIHLPTAADKGQTTYAFTVRAEFDDGSVGDITSSDNYSPIAADDDLFGESNFLILPTTLTAGTDRTVTIETTPEWGGLQADAKIVALDPWATANDIPQAAMIDGRAEVWDGVIKPERVANILFLGVGYQAKDQPSFNALTDLVVHKFRSDPRFNPYLYLSQSMNYWRAFVPAKNPGVCVRAEMYPVLDDGQLWAQPVPAPKPPPTAGEWELPHLIFQAGLPVPADANLVKPDAHHPGKFDTTLARAKFAAILPNVPAGAIPDDLIVEWLALAKRTFIDEIDNFPALAVGEPPSVRADFDPFGEVSYHPLRGATLIKSIGEVERFPFFRRITAEPRNGIIVSVDDNGSDGPELGNLWGEDRTSFDFDNRIFVVAIGNLPVSTNTSFGRALWRGNAGVACVPPLRTINGKEFDGIPVTINPQQNAFVLKVPLAANVEFDNNHTRRTIGHELGHAYTLGDEYGKDSAPAGPHDGDDANLMLYRNVLRTDQTTDPTVQIDNIKWNWDRINKASIINQPVNDMANGTFRVFVAKGRGFQFLPGDPVRLRKRDPKGTLSAFPRTSVVEFTVDSVHPENLDNLSDPVNMTVVIKNESIGINVAPFGPGSIIYKPVLAPPGITPYRPYLTLVPPVSERIMSAIGGTMTGTACDPTNTDLADQDVQTPKMPANAVPNLPAGVKLPGLVGVYFGGSQHACGVIHPTGSCIMRASQDRHSRFCPVCRYVIVDLLDPEQHWQVDRDYDKEYIL